MGEGLVERVARKLSWPNEEETRRGLALYRAEFARIMGQVRRSLAEIKAFAARFPAVDWIVVPDELEKLSPGSVVESTEAASRPDSADTNPLMALTKDTPEQVMGISALLDEWEAQVEEIEGYVESQLRALLSTTSASTLEAIEAHLDAIPRPDFKITPGHDHRESAGLRQTLLAYLPHEVGDGLSQVVAYLYDQALEAGDIPGPAGYIEREFWALGEDLGYLAWRFRALSKVTPHMTVGESDRGRIDTAAGVATHLQNAIERLDEAYGR